MTYHEELCKKMAALDCSVRFTSSSATYKDNPQGVGQPIPDNSTRCTRCHVIDNTTKEEYHVEIDKGGAMDEQTLLGKALAAATSAPKPLTLAQKATLQAVEGAVKESNAVLIKRIAELEARLANGGEPEPVLPAPSGSVDESTGPVFPEKRKPGRPRKIVEV